ncbi:MAG TPA: 3-deoxy-manno-octulosonate cytidylyltransferase [Candidatus Cloacimonadota bacterium]|jgi:3-deoxy-manno-octulosonate cytidylyltransferase (CMP-KDO synthetase)|nr:3-deoxy-manno-octulosonate cytidylyltransferase [Candidatus Cloacimonadota bacterium]
MNTAIAIIPARYASSRFPGKALALLGGKPVIQHVYERVLASGIFSTVAVATDDERIASAVCAFGGQCIMTDAALASGTDRIAAALQEFRCSEDSIIFNVQGDEPLISTEPLAALLAAFDDPEVEMASLMSRMDAADEPGNPNQVKVVVDKSYYALYFSRSIIPYDRDGGQDYGYMRHIGVYAYRQAILQRFVSLPPSKLETMEKLEQLRALENGIRIKMVATDYQGIGIDTPEDLANMETLMQGEPGL